MTDLLDLINDAHTAIPFGTVNITLKKSDGKVMTLDTTKITRSRVTGSAQALTMIGTMLKMMSEAKVTGDLTVTVQLDQGQGKWLMTHDFKRINL